jgi:Right handed beta helix region
MRVQQDTVWCRPTRRWPQLRCRNSRQKNQQKKETKMNPLTHFKKILILPLLIPLALVAEPLTSRTGDAASNMRMRVVNCDRGENIAEVLARAEPGDTIRVTGTCAERVSIKTDRITLDGQGAATLDGGGGPIAEFDGVVTIDGASGVTIQGFTVQNGPGEGILGSVRNTTVQDNGFTGVAVAEGSTAELTDCRILRNGGPGIDVFTQSSAVLKGAIRTNENLGPGAVVNGTSILEIRGAQVEASRNGGFGLVAGSNSQLAILGFAGSRGSTFTIDANAQGGIALGDSILNVFSESTIAITNSPLGIHVPGGKIVSPFGVGTFVIENNGVGLNFGLDGTAIFRGGLTVRNNGTGVRTQDGAGVLWFISIPPNPSAITGNGVDVDLRFGARATFDGVEVGTITCDSTVLSRGTTVCP